LLYSNILWYLRIFITFSTGSFSIVSPLFPLTVFEGALTIDDEHIDRLKTCNKNPLPETTIYEACREELKYFFGEKDFNKLEDYRKQYLSSLKTKDVAWR